MIGKLKKPFPTFDLKKDDIIDIIAKVKDASYDSGYYFECVTFKKEVAYIDIKEVIIDLENSFEAISKNEAASDNSSLENEQDAFDKKKFWFGK